MSNENESLSARAGAFLTERNWTIATAESCTGGLLSSMLTDISGSSAYVQGGIITYSNEAKMNLLGVDEQTLILYGAVSPETAREMALNTKRMFGANVGIGITGIAGPGGGTPEKPVGLVYIGVASGDSVEAFRYVWDGDRIANKRYSAEQALRLILSLDD